MRWVLSPKVLKAIVLPLLQGLSSTTQVTGDDPKASQALLLQSPNHLKQRLNRLELLTRHKVLFPIIIDCGSRIGMYSKGRDHIRGIKPLGMLVPNRIN
jgi:hypothetical protein